MARETTPTLKYEVEIAMLEIYMEEVYNLLVPRAERAPLKVPSAAICRMPLHGSAYACLRIRRPSDSLPSHSFASTVILPASSRDLGRL